MWFAASSQSATGGEIREYERHVLWNTAHPETMSNPKNEKTAAWLEQSFLKIIPMRLARAAINKYVYQQEPSVRHCIAYVVCKSARTKQKKKYHKHAWSFRAFLLCAWRAAFSRASSNFCRAGDKQKQRHEMTSWPFTKNPHTTTLRTESSTGILYIKRWCDGGVGLLWNAVWSDCFGAVCHP